MDEFQGWDGFLFDPEEVVIVIDHDVLAFFLVPGFHLEGHDFGFFVPEDGDLLFGECGFGQE